MELGYRLGEGAKSPAVFCFFGDLAAGKTTLIKGMVAGATGISQEQVSSPTYVLLNIYEGRRSLYHFDLYRLQSSEEFLGMGFDDYWQGEGICCIEWSERIQDLIPPDAIQIQMKSLSSSKREIRIEKN